MKLFLKFDRKHVSWLMVLISVIGFLVILYLDQFYWRTGIIPEMIPNYSSEYTLRSIFIFILSLLFTISLYLNQSELIIKNKAKFTIKNVPIIIWIILLSSFLPTLFIFKDYYFNQMSYEDRIVEWLSTVLLFASSFHTAYVLRRNHKYGKSSVLYSIILITLSILLFLIAMEEISWFQRLLGFETSGIFNSNQQKEINFHNFATAIFENLYYFGAFLFLVILPFLKLLYQKFNESELFKFVIPDLELIIIGGIGCAYNYDMWNNAFIQFMFFCSLIIILILFLLSKSIMNKLLLGVSAGVVLMSQVVYLKYGINLSRFWNMTEYRELFIPIGFFVYSILLSQREFKNIMDTQLQRK